MASKRELENRAKQFATDVRAFMEWLPLRIPECSVRHRLVEAADVLGSPLLEDEAAVVGRRRYYSIRNRSAMAKRCNIFLRQLGYLGSTAARSKRVRLIDEAYALQRGFRVFCDRGSEDRKRA